MTGACQAVTFAWYDRRWVPLLLLVLFFPVGLWALWANHRFSRWTKIALTALLPFLVMVGSIQRAAVKRSLTEADNLWDSSRQEPAVAQYKKLLTENCSSLQFIDRKRAFQRVIDFELARGGKDEATNFVDAAVASGTPLVLRSPEGATILAAAQARRKPSQDPESGASERKLPFGLKREARLYIEEKAGKTRAAPIAETQEALKQYEKDFGNADTVGMMQKLGSFRVLLFDQEAPVLVIEQGFSFTSFRDPRMMGTLYWVRSEYVHPTGQ